MMCLSLLFVVLCVCCASCTSLSFSRLHILSSCSISFLISSCAQRHSSWISLASSGVSPTCVAANSGCTNDGRRRDSVPTSLFVGLVQVGGGCVCSFCRYSCCSHNIS